MFEIKEVSDEDADYPGNVNHLMPKLEEIPDEFRLGYTTWNKLVTDWFFTGLLKLELTPRKGVNTRKALRHIKCIIGSYEPEHEYKEAACAFLFSEWFSDAKWEKKS